MTHPILSQDAKNIRDRMRSFLQEHAYSVRNSNIVFVCGGNGDDDMRTKFREYAKEELKEYKIYLPEFSFENIFSLKEGGVRFIDLNRFEEVVAALSCCVVLFPEAPGSLVELGLFSSNKEIIERLLVVIDSEHDDGKDDFITLGPVNTINGNSNFKPVFVDSYDSINFEKIKNRIKDRYRIPSKHRKIEFTNKKWRELTYFEKLSVVHWIVEICRLSNVDAVQFLSKSLFGTTVKKNEIIDLLSVLIGSNEFSFYGEEKWIRIDKEFTPIITTKSKESMMLTDLQVDISNLYLENPNFNLLVKDAYS